MARPRKLLAEKYLTPARQFGRVAAPDWDTLQRAAKAEGMTLTAWLLSVTLPRAKKFSRRKPRKNRAFRAIPRKFFPDSLFRVLTRNR